MAKGKGQINGWITKNGVHIPIYGHYSVRGGEEPKAKGAKFKRKKRPEEFDKDIRETESGKFMAQYSSDQGRKKGVKDIEKPFETREGARKFLAEENGEYEDAKFNKEADDREEVSIDAKGNIVSRRSAKRQKPKREEPVPNTPEVQNARHAMALEAQRPGGPNEKMMAELKRDYDNAVAQARESQRSGQESSTPAEPYAKSNNKYLGQSVKDLNKLDVRNLNDSELSQLREHASASSRTGARGADKLWKNVDAEINRRVMGQESSTPTIHETRLQRQAVNEKAGLKSDRNQNFKTAYQNEESSTPKTNKTDAHNDKIFTDFKANGKDYQRVSMEDYAGSINDFKAAAKRAGVDYEYDKGDDTFYLRKSKQDSLSAGMNKRSQIRAQISDTNKAKGGNFGDMTVSGLKQALAGARPGDKTKIRAELRKRGYTYVGGKWVKA